MKAIDTHEVKFLKAGTNIARRAATSHVTSRFSFFQLQNSTSFRIESKLNVRRISYKDRLLHLRTSGFL